MGFYSSRMSAWERRRAGLPNDHCGPTSIEEDGKIIPEKEEKVVEEVKVEKKETKAKSKTKAKKKTTKK